MRAGDGWNTQSAFDDTYPQGTAPGQYRFTPGYTFALLPHWGSLPPFVLKDGTQYQPPAPYPINSKRYTQDYNEIKRLGGDGVTTASARTPDQTEIALFWVESSPLMWNRIGRTALLSHNLGMWENARLLALLNLGLADGYISCWSAKFLYNYWRPVTAIREGWMDGNDDTAGDPTWTPLVLTPPIPEYDSGHGVEGGVGATILQRFFKADRIGFVICSTTPPRARPVTALHPGLARSAASRRPPMRTDYREFWSAFTSATPLTRGSYTERRLAIGYSRMLCGLSVKTKTRMNRGPCPAERLQ